MTCFLPICLIRSFFFQTGTITEQKPVVEDPAIETVTKEDE